MRKYVLLPILSLILFCNNAQVPKAFKYQAIIRDANGDMLPDKKVSIKVILLSGYEKQQVYSELHTVLSNSYGLISLNIGQGDYPTCEFSCIDWSSGNIFLQLELDEKGGGDFKSMGTSQLLSVPFALYAEESGNQNRGATEWTNDGTNIYNDETILPGSNVGIGTTSPDGKLKVYDQGFSNPNAPMLFVEHDKGFSSTFRRNFEGKGNALFLLQKARGTISSPSVVQDGDYVGQIRMEAYDGSDYQTTGWVRSAVDGDVSTGKVPGALKFATTDTVGNVTERMTITSSGAVGIGTSMPHSSAILHIGGWGVNDKGVILPWVYNNAMLSIENPVAGLMVYNVNLQTICWYNGMRWVPMNQRESCGSSLIYGNQVYNTILIAGRCWMEENLNIGTRINGGIHQSHNSIKEKYCYNDDENMCDIFGGLYQWREIMQYYDTTEGSQGICPYGWHIPTDAEWTEMIDHYEGVNYAGGKLKSTGTIFQGTGLWTLPNLGATNESGFKGHPGGLYSSSSGVFSAKNIYGYFWTSTPNSSTTAKIKGMYYNSEAVLLGNYNKAEALSVRCIMDRIYPTF